VGPGAALNIVEKREIRCTYRDSKSLVLQLDNCLKKINKTPKTVGQVFGVPTGDITGQTLHVIS
jgi:hypothetical protein